MDEGPWNIAPGHTALLLTHRQLLVGQGRLWVLQSSSWENTHKEGLSQLLVRLLPLDTIVAFSWLKCKETSKMKEEIL